MSGAININSASPEELATLPGIGPTVARRIAAHRERFGEFETLEDLLGVGGITERIVDAIRDLVNVGSSEAARDEDRAGRSQAYDDGGYGEDNPPVTPGKHHGGDPVRIHEEYVRHHLEGGTPATAEAYERAREQFLRLPGSVQRPPTDVTVERSGDPSGAESNEGSR